MLIVYLIVVGALIWALSIFSYIFLKNQVVKRQKWDLNICAGKTDGGGINADIVEHAKLPNFILLKDIYHLPFPNKQFKSVLSSHTIEHVDDPTLFYKELQRVGEQVTLLVPPLWDLAGALNILEHKWIFLSLKTEHTTLPPHIRLPFASSVHKLLGQRMHA